MIDRGLSRCISHEDYRRLARERLPRVLFDFIDGGAEDETTVGANRTAFGEVTFRVRKGVNVVPHLATSVLGDEIAAPILIAPCGFARLVHPAGELALARAATAAGLAYVVPHVSGYSLEDVRGSAAALLWYQIYKLGGRDVAEPAIRRAYAAGYRALVVTIDNPGSKRERDIRNGLAALRTGSIAKSWRRLPQVFLRPRWLAGFVADGRPLASPNLMLPGGGTRPANNPGQSSEPTFVWSDFDWIRTAWPGPIVVKGIQTAEDARRAVDAGASAVVVSNHGGRNFDGEPAALTALPEVVAAIDGRAEVLFDSGIRRGADIAKALALGARAVLIGRLSMFALSAGQPGVDAVLRMLKEELAATLAGIGCSDVAALDRSFVNVPPHWIAPAQR